MLCRGPFYYYHKLTKEELEEAHARCEALVYGIAKAKSDLNALKGRKTDVAKGIKKLEWRIRKYKGVLEMFRKVLNGFTYSRPAHLPAMIGGNAVVRELPMDDLHSTYAGHHRLETFAHKGLKCSWPECSKVGKHLILTIGVAGDLHADIYTKDFTLMNVDHIHPVSLGGSDHITNKQPMCERHNSKKGSKPMPNV